MLLVTVGAEVNSFVAAPRARARVVLDVRSRCCRTAMVAADFKKRAGALAPASSVIALDDAIAPAMKKKTKGKILRVLIFQVMNYFSLKLKPMIFHSPPT